MTKTRVGLGTTKGKRPRGGVTLLETLVAFAVLSLIFATVYGLVHQSSVFQKNVGGREATQEAALLCLRHLIAELGEARSCVYPYVNPDGSPTTASFLIVRSFEEEPCFYYLDPTANALMRARVRWTADGSGFEPIAPEPILACPDFQSLYFTVASGSAGETQIRICLQTKKDWFFECVTPWNGPL